MYRDESKGKFGCIGNPGVIVESNFGTSNDFPLRTYT